jgi:hypothetical protein
VVLIFLLICDCCIEVLLIYCYNAKMLLKCLNDAEILSKCHCNAVVMLKFVMLLYIVRKSMDTRISSRFEFGVTSMPMNTFVGAAK